MKILFITQVFWPDTVSVAQQMWDFSQYLMDRSHQVSVFSSKYSYESSQKTKYKAKENIRGLEIFRIRHTNFSKRFIIGRLLNMITFNMSICLKLARLKNGEYDIIFGTTVPPFLSFFGLLIARQKKIPFSCWIMDLQPELAIQAGLIKKNSMLSTIFNILNRFILKKSDLIIALDIYMEAYIKKIRSETICTAPVWSVAYSKYKGEFENNPFRVRYHMSGKIVVMYSGNHAYIHPLETLLKAALQLKNNNNFLFAFIGDGVRKKDVTDFKIKYKLNNIMQINFQPRENIHNSLAAANIQVVIIGDGQVGFTHPSKIYGALDVSCPILYIGPSPSHVGDILKNLPGNISISHGEVDILVTKLLEFSCKSSAEIREIKERNMLFGNKHFSSEISKDKMANAIESIVHGNV